MSQYATLKAAITAAIKQNGNNEITGNLLQQQLLAMVNSLGANYQYAGIATPATNPGTPDQNVFYIASTAGTYANFGGLVLADGEIAILKYNGAWSKDSTGAATQESVNQLGQEVTDFEGEVIGFQQEQINLAQYDLVNGYISGTDFYAYLNYGIYHRCKFVPISIHHGREISIYKNPNESRPVTFAVVKTLPTLDGQNHALDFAAGFSAVIDFGDSGSPYTFTIGEDANYLIFYITDTRETWDKTPQSVILAAKDGNYYDKQETDALLADKADDSDITELSEQISGLDERTNNIEEECLTESESPEAFPVTIHTENGTNGYWGMDGAWHSDDTRRSTDKIDVSPGDKFLVTTKISASSLIAFLAQWNDNSFVGVANGFAGGSGDAVDREYTVPEGVNKIAICSSNSTEPSLKKIVVSSVRNFYNKSEADARFAAKSSVGRYGVKWSTTDKDDLGTSCFDAVGKTASIGIGNTNGSSDFDSIYPWSEMKRCNIKVNANGAKIVTFEGEPGFSLSGVNGDVFVRIPKFCVEKYKEDGYEYRVVSRNQGLVHPAFIENGEEIDEIFVAAFEGYVNNNKLHSVQNSIPTSNITAQSFLDYAKAKGEGYSLYDMRSMDAIWTLYAVEFGSRNTNQIFGYGFADFRQPDKGASGGRFDVKEAATNTNSVKVALLNSDYLYYMPLGSNITVCRNTQTNILTQAKITGIESGADYTMFTFDGDPIDVDTDCFIGSAGCTTNFCELCGAAKRLNWHTGRAEFISGSQKQNPMRYRWIENIFGSLWHFMPDITLNELQLYVCDNIKDYEFGKITAPYRPVGPLMTEQTSNGQKNDNTGVNYWIDSLIDDIFAKGITLGKSFDMSLTSRKAFGAFYYANGLGIRINVNGGGFDHDVRCNMLTNRLWITTSDKWYLYGARLMYKNID